MKITKCCIKLIIKCYMDLEKVLDTKVKALHQCEEVLHQDNNEVIHTFWKALHTKVLPWGISEKGSI